MGVIRYKDIDVNDLVISKPKKGDDGVYHADMLLSDEGFIFQTPSTLVYNTVEKVLSFDLVRKGDFYTFIENIRDHCIDYIYDNSEDFFKGKKFSKNFIRESFVRPIDINEEGFVIMSDMKTDDKCKVYDCVMDEVIDKKEMYKGTYIIQVTGVRFRQKTVYLDMKILSIKISPENQRRILEECILDEDESLPSEDEIDSVKAEIEVLSSELRDENFF